MPVKQDVYYGITANFTSHDSGIQLETISPKSISRISLVCAFKTRDAGWPSMFGGHLQSMFSSRSAVPQDFLLIFLDDI